MSKILYIFTPVKDNYSLMASSMKRKNVCLQAWVIDEMG